VPGDAPGGAPTFLVSPRKVGKRRRPYCLRPCAPERRPGQAAVLAPGGVARNSLRSNNRAPFIRRALRSSAQTEGRGYHTGLRYARPFGTGVKFGVRLSNFRVIARLARGAASPGWRWASRAPARDRRPLDCRRPCGSRNHGADGADGADGHGHRALCGQGACPAQWPKKPRPQ